MPVKIRHKQLGTVETVAYVNWAGHYNHQLWDIVEMWDVGKIFNVQSSTPIYQSTVDYSDFLDAMKHPINQNALRFDPLPDIGNTGNNAVSTLVEQINDPVISHTVETNRLERKFLNFIDNRTTALATEIDIEEFMVSSFKKPNPKSDKTLNATDKGVIFLKTLKAKRLIDFDNEALSHVNKWTVDADGKIKRWFDTLHEPLYVTINYPMSEFLPLWSRLSNKKFVLKQIKYAIKNGIRYGVKLLIGVWKYIVLVSATFLGGWLALDDNFKHFIAWVKNII